MSRSIWHYGRGIAYSAIGGGSRRSEARTSRILRNERVVPETSILFNNTSRTSWGLPKRFAGEIPYRALQHAMAYEHLLGAAVKRDDALNYDEPWGWMQPARHALGALLLEQDHAAEAEIVYREDLKRHPNNVWSLHGLAESLEKQDRLPEANELRQQCTKAGARADVKVDRSCFCRTAPQSEQ